MKSNSEVKQLVPSVIMEELSFDGDIIGEGALEVDGKVNGNIRCLSASVGITGLVIGDITAERVEVLGEVVGNITAKKIICGASAKVRGNILHSSIHIENGANIDGSCRKFVQVDEPAIEAPEEPEQMREIELHQEEYIQDAPIEPAQSDFAQILEAQDHSAEPPAELASDYVSEDLIYKKEA